MHRAFASGRIIRGLSKSACQILRHKSTSTGPNIEGFDTKKIAFGVGLGTTVAAVAGTALYSSLKTEPPKHSIKTDLHYETDDKLEYVENKVINKDEISFDKPEININEDNADDSKTDKKSESQITGPEETENSQVTPVVPKEVDPKLIEELETLRHAFEMSYLAAMSTYSLAAQSVRGLKSDLEQYAEELNEIGIVPASSDAVVLQLLEKNKQGQKFITDAEKAATQARLQIATLRNFVSTVSDSEKALLDHNIEDIETQLSEAEPELKFAEDFLKQALLNPGPPDILQKRVSKVTSDLEEELGFSFHGSGNNEKREIFLKAMAWQLLQYRKEIEKVVDLQEKRTRHLLAAKGDQGSENRLQVLLIDKEEDLKQLTHKENYAKLMELKLKLELEYKEKLLQNLKELNKEKETVLQNERAAFERELTEELKKAQDHNNHIQKELIIAFHDVLIPNLTAIQGQVKTSADALTLATASHKLVDVLKTDPFPQLDWNHQIQPISHFIKTIHDTSSTDKTTDEFIHIITSTLPDQALNRGVYTLTALKKRFNEVEKVARKVSMLKEREGNSTLMYMMSYFRNFLIIRPVSAVSKSELENQPISMDKLDNDHLLDRAKIFLEQGDLRQAVSYMNMLQGVAQFVSSGWCEEVCIYLEVMQAAQALKTFSMLLVHHTIKQQRNNSL